MFASNYPWLLGLNAFVALSLLVLIIWQVRDLWREHQARIFGSRLKLRLMLMFGLMAVLPGVLIYAVSVQFVTKSIDSWFDVRVERHWSPDLTSGVAPSIPCSTILPKRTSSWRSELGNQSESQHRLALVACANRRECGLLPCSRLAAASAGDCHQRSGEPSCRYSRRSNNCVRPGSDEVTAKS
ncbi:MAG: hypothetical protein IPN98_15435 [Propionivibrio sp.]|nr:hypothetical protein [Propionivibrio sp.]